MGVLSLRCPRFPSPAAQIRQPPQAAFSATGAAAPRVDTRDECACAGDASVSADRPLPRSDRPGVRARDRWPPRSRRPSAVWIRTVDGGLDTRHGCLLEPWAWVPLPTPWFRSFVFEWFLSANVPDLSVLLGRSRSRPVRHTGRRIEPGKAIQTELGADAESSDSAESINRASHLAIPFPPSDQKSGIDRRRSHPSGPKVPPAWDLGLWVARSRRAQGGRREAIDLRRNLCNGSFLTSWSVPVVW